MFPETSSRETLRFSRNKIHCSPRDQSLSVNCVEDVYARIFDRQDKILVNFRTTAQHVSLFKLEKQRPSQGLKSSRNLRSTFNP